MILRRPPYLDPEALHNGMNQFDCRVDNLAGIHDGCEPVGHLDVVIMGLGDDVQPHLCDVAIAVLEDFPFHLLIHVGKLLFEPFSVLSGAEVFDGN